MSNERKTIELGSELYSKLYGGLAQGILVIRNSRIFYVNDTFVEMIDVPLSRILQWTEEDLLNMLLEEDREIAKEVYSLGTDRYPSMETRRLRFIHRTKGVRHFEVTPNIIESGDQVEFLAFITDVTDYVYAMEELESGKKKISLYKEIFERSNDAIAIVDERGEYLEQNNSHRQLIGFSDSYLRGRTPSIHLGKEIFQGILSELRENGTYRGEIKSKTRTGSEIIHDTSAFSISDEKDGVRCYVSITRDITEKARAEEYLRSSEREKSVILDSMTDHVNYYNIEDMRIVRTNSAAARSLNLKPEELVGQYCHKLWHNLDEPCAECPVIHARDSGTPQEDEIQTPDGRYWMIKGFPVIDDEGKVTGIVEVTREVTEQKKAIEDTRNARARAELFNDLMAHDLNNINQGIMASLELILLRGEIPEPIREPLESALDQVKRGVALISNVRKFSKIDREPSDLAPLDIHPALVAASDMVMDSFPERVFDIDIQLSEGQYEVLADEFLQDAFYNILHNSAKHDEQEKISIEISASLDKTSGYVDIIFDDHGPGIQDSLKMRILSRLYETGSQGSGLGLTLIQRIAQRYKGHVLVNDRVENEPEKGARVIIRIPTIN